MKLGNLFDGKDSRVDNIFDYSRINCLGYKRPERSSIMLHQRGRLEIGNVVALWRG
jgi:hypothetical protein